MLRKELAGVCKACFSTNPAHRHAHVVAQYRKQFVNELNPEATAFPSTLGELSGALALRSTELAAAWGPFPIYTAVQQIDPMMMLRPGSVPAM